MRDDVWISAMSFFSKRLRIDRLAESTEIFPPLDVEAIARDLRLKTRGTERGRQNLPGPDDKGRDPVEHELLNAIEDEVEATAAPTIH